MRPVAREAVTCAFCMAVFYALPCKKRKYCSPVCAKNGNWSSKEYREHMSVVHKGSTPPMKGKKHSRSSIEKMRDSSFRGCHKVVRKNGYVYVYSPDHHRAINGRVPEQVLIMEIYLNRHLSKDEIVHHINGNKLDNSIENLEVMTSREHRSHHAKERGFGKTRSINIGRNQENGRYIKL